IPFAYSATASVTRPNVALIHAWYAEHKTALGSCPDNSTFVQRMGDFAFMTRLGLLAHSAPSATREPQSYEEHVSNVQRRAREHAEAMLRFATPRNPK